MPTQLPRESTDFFGDLLYPHALDILQSDATAPLENHNFTPSVAGESIQLLTSSQFIIIFELMMINETLNFYNKLIVMLVFVILLHEHQFLALTFYLDLVTNSFADFIAQLIPFL